jgi:hypothetical protein
MGHAMPNIRLRHLLLAAGLAAALPAISAAEEPQLGLKVIQNRSIGYLLTDFFWAVYETPDAKQECPQGLNQWGPREQFKALFPEDGTPRTVQDTWLAREIAGWFPNADEPDKFPFYEAQGPIAYGFNLDGKVGPHDFTSPEGEKGIDNQLYRVIGCVPNLRPPLGQTAYFADKAIGEERWNRMLIEITNLDDLTNDDDVDVTIYRGKDHILTDATGNTIMSGGSQRIDDKWGTMFIQRMHGHIKNGVLETVPVKYAVLPWSSFQLPTVQKFHDMRLRLKLTPTGAEGMFGGYVDVENWYMQTVRSESTHHQSYGQSSPPSEYKVLRRLADAYPDAEGHNTAISAALQTKLVQAFIIHPSHETTPQYLAESTGPQEATKVPAQQ